MSNYKESSYKKESMVIKIGLELWTQIGWKLKQLTKLKADPTFSSVQNLSSIKLVSSV